MFPLSSCQGDLAWYIYNCIAEIKRIITSILPRAEKENRERQRKLGAVVCKRGDAKRGKSVCGAVNEQT